MFIKLLKNLWITARPHFFFVSGAAGIAGMAIGYSNPPLWITCSIFLICFFSYGLIQMLCDTFDIETDKINAPFRPMVTGELPVKTVWLLITTLLIIITILFYIINPLLLILEFIALVFSFTYNRMKRITHAGPLWNGIIVGTLPLMGFFAVSGINSISDLPSSGYIISVIYCLVYAGFVLTGYFKDVKGDTSAGYITAPVRYSPEKAKWQVLPYTLTAIGGIIIFIIFNEQIFSGLALYETILTLLTALTGVTFIMISNILLIKNPSESSSYVALLWYTRGMVLYFLFPLFLFNIGIGIIVVFVFMSSLEYFLSLTKDVKQA